VIDVEPLDRYKAAVCEYKSVINLWCRSLLASSSALSPHYHYDCRLLWV